MNTKMGSQYNSEWIESENPNGEMKENTSFDRDRKKSRIHKSNPTLRGQGLEYDDDDVNDMII